jgi:hypothetical protein
VSATGGYEVKVDIKNVDNVNITGITLTPRTSPNVKNTFYVSTSDNQLHFIDNNGTDRIVNLT